jgi:hypothetical protein
MACGVCLPSNACTLTLRALQSEVRLNLHSLSLAPSELAIIAFTHPLGGIDGIGVVDAPSCPPPSYLSITCLQKHVRSGRAAAFLLAPPAEAGCGSPGSAVCSSIAALAQVIVVLQTPDDARALQAAAPLLPVTYEPSATHGGVLITVLVPASAPEGSRVVISRASVAGYDVALGGVPLQATVGFNHTPAQAGPVFKAARWGDVPALSSALDGGASTEEMGEVRVPICSLCGVSTVLCYRSVPSRPPEPGCRLFPALSYPDLTTGTRPLVLT